MPFPNLSFTRIILQANPSENYGNCFSCHSTRKMQSLCCPIQLVVTTLAPKNKLWERRERKNHLSWLTWVLFSARNRNYCQESPTLWQPGPQQPEKQSRATTDWSFLQICEGKNCGTSTGPNEILLLSFVQHLGVCATSELSTSGRWEVKSNKTDFSPLTEALCDSFSWVWRQTLSCVCSAPAPHHLHWQIQSPLTDVGQRPLPGILSQTEIRNSQGC